MPMPILPAGYLFQRGVAKGVQEVKDARDNTQYQRAYFKGLSGLSADAREAWEKQYLNDISGLSNNDRDEFFRNTVFKDLYKDSENPADQEIWNNRYNMSLEDRDIFVAKKAISGDLDERSDYKEQGLSLLETLLSPEETVKKIESKVGEKTLRDQATDFLTQESEQLRAIRRAQVDNMDSDQRENLASNFDTMSKEAIPLYNEYIDTDKLPLNSYDIAQLAADYSAWQQIGGDEFAYRMLNKTYQGIVASHQSIWEKSVNTAAQFGDSAAGMIIRAAGMAAGIVGIGRDEEDQDDSYWDNILDNAVTRYGDRIATTQSWNVARQKYLEENGLQDNPILNTFDQQNSILSWNTPFELLGQYGFTAASTLLSFGGSAAAEGLVKTAGWVGKVATGSKGLNTTAKGVKLARALTRAKDIGNILVVGGIGGVEGGMNAVGTKNKVLKDLNADIDADYNKYIDADIEKFVRENPQGALSLLAQTGADMSEPYTEEEVLDALKSDRGVRETIGKNLPPDVIAELANRKAAAEKSAQTAMTVDFIGNSIINGFVNSTLQATLNAPSIQRSLRKVGLQQSPLDDLGVGIIKGENSWEAAAKRFTKWDGVKSRLKEAWGEGIEEYTQDISGAFGEGFAKDKMSQYLDWKYGDSEGSEAFEEDFYRSLLTGLQYAGESAFSEESIKDGLYGLLSTALGGPNANLNNRGKAERQEGESGLDYAKRRSLVTWRSALGPLFNNETDEVNEKRDETAKRINDFFSDVEKQNLFFNLEASTNAMRNAQAALKSGDEKAIRDARVAELVANIFTVNELKGSAYYDAVMASLQARANFDANNLNDPNSTESKAVEQYIADVRNRGLDISAEEAFETIKKSASDMLSMMEQVNQESAATEKLYGSEIDRDTKEALVYARVSANDAKRRMEALDKELAQVTAALDKKDDSSESSGLSSRSKRLIAKFGSLAAATRDYEKKVAEKEEIDELVKELKDEIKADKVTNAALASKKERKKAKEDRQMAEVIVKINEEKSKKLGREIEEAKRDIDRYRREAPKETKVTTDEKGNEVTSEILSGREVITAKEIMALDAVDRAIILDPRNRNRFSAEQQAEIDKVNLAGQELFDDFTSKAVDRGRLEVGYNNVMATMLHMSREPQAFARYEAAVKKNKQERLLEKKYDYLASYDATKTYSEFASELSRILEEEPEADQKAAIRVLKRANSAYYERHKQQKDVLGGIYSKLSSNEAYNKLSDNDKNLFANTIEYLVDKGIDLDDTNAVVEALSEVAVPVATDVPNVFNFTYDNPFAKYVEETNARVKDNEKATYTTPGEVIQNFKDVMAAFKKDREEQAANNRPVEVQPTTPEQSAPAQAPTPQVQPGISGSGAYSSPEGGHPKGSDEAPQPVAVQPQNPQNGPSSGGAVVEAFTNNSNEAVAKAAETAINTAKNTPESVADKKAIDIAVKKIESLKDSFFDTVKDFTDELLKEANQLDMQGDKDSQAAAGVLRRAASTAENQSKMAAKPQQQQQQQLTGLAARNFKYTNIFNAASQAGGISPNSSIISTLDIQGQKKRHPNGALTKFLNKYKVEEFLSNPEALAGDRRVVKFMVESQLAADTQQSMEESGSAYTKDAIPVVPVVEVKEKSDHVITVVEDGEEHYYQPIGVLPATYNTWTSGAARLGKLRDLASSQEQNKLIRDEQGNVVSTTIVGSTGGVTATPPQHLAENQSVVRAGINSLSAEEKAEMSGKSKEEARKTSAYQKIKDRFLSRLTIKPNKYGTPELYLDVNNLKGDGSSPGFMITVTPVQKTQAKNSSKLIIDLFREGSIAEAISANSRIEKFGKKLREFFDGNKLTMTLFDSNADGSYAVSKEGEKYLNGLADSLGKTLGNYIVLPSKIDGGPVRYTLTPAYDSNNQLRRGANGAPIFVLSAVNDKMTIPLTEITDGQIEDINVFDTLKHLFLDEQGQPRMRDAKEGFVKWQVSYPDVKAMGTNEIAASNISQIYDDGILEASVESFDYAVNSVQFNAPFTIEGIPAYPTTTVVNGDNAQGSQDSSVAQTPSGQTVDPSSGIVVEQTGEGAQKPLSPAAKIAAKIMEDSKHIKLSEDGSSYVDDRTGKVYARVTSIIAADETAADDERFGADNPWGLPSSNIGTAVDELVRDFFGNTLKESYPNMKKKDIDAFVEGLKVLKNQLTASGLTIVPRDVTVTGTLNAADSEGKTHQVNVAGTLDLLAYDAQGNFYIFDMKTFHTSIDAHKKAKYSRQLSLYKKFLEDAYGVTVKDLKIIPIKVNYPHINKVTYGLKEGVPNQLTTIDKHSEGKAKPIDFDGARPELKALIPLWYTEPHIQFDRLTDAEKEMFRGIQETVQEGGPAVNNGGPNSTTSATVTEITPAPATAIPVDPYTGMPMVGYESPLLAGLPKPQAGQSTVFTASSLRWGTWEGFTPEQKKLINEGLAAQGYHKEEWESNDPLIRVSDAEKEQVIKCILGLKN